MVQQVMAKNYCFTLNNPSGPLVPHKDIGYLIYQHERGINGTLHFQGYFECHTKTRITSIKKMGAPWSLMHLEVRKGTQLQAIEYCTKEDTRVEGTEPISYGTPTEHGKARGYSAMVQAISNGVDVTKDEEHLEQYIKHKKNVDEIMRERKKVKRSDLECNILLVQWQTDLVNIFSKNPHARTIHWRWESKGNSGKTTFTKYLVKHFGAIMVDTTQKERIIRAYNGEPIVVFDITRAEGKEDRVNYGIMETLKNGIGFNTMYEPGMKLWRIPHVIVFSNFPPTEGKLSVDRLDTIEIPSLSDSLRLLANAANDAYVADYSS